MSRHRLRVDWPACRARGLCAELLPEVIAVDDWGYPVVAPGLDDTLTALAREAVSYCPHLALRLVEVPD
jgi:ferredoxin